jgi:poly-gamma-glutamate capsule biosynthesis protein CapA/YwtB (metallophosphatase superfamily)
VRVINLDCAVTRSNAFASGKAVHYRMEPANLPCLTAIRPDACALANNHVLDFGSTGLTDILPRLASAGLAAAGAGHDLTSAQQAAEIPLRRGGRVDLLLRDRVQRYSRVVGRRSRATRAGLADQPRRCCGRQSRNPGAGCQTARRHRCRLDPLGL